MLPDPFVDHFGEVLAGRRLARSVRRLHALARVAKLIIRLRHPSMVAQAVTSGHLTATFLPNSSLWHPSQPPFPGSLPNGKVVAMTASTWVLTLVAVVLYGFMIRDIMEEVRGE
ncbi:hypothetical protein GCM10010522_04860 [Kribbella solani]